MSVRLQRGPFSLTLSPRCGGSVLRFQHNDTDILRPTAPNLLETWSGNARDFAAFPMVPFTSRITDGAFISGDQTIKLPANMPPDPHAIHGLGWQSMWDVSQLSTSTVTLTHTHKGSEWPWPYTAQQVFALNDTGLSLTLSLTNHGDAPMPAGFGWHPYFPRPGAHVKASTRRVWLSRNEFSAIPADSDISAGRAVADLNLDHVFNVAAPVQTIQWPGLTLTLKSDPVFNKLIVYVPPGRDYFCVEPVTHAPDAVNSTLSSQITGLHMLQHDETLSGTITLTISATP
ncbi:MAG: aldose 1-epimerase [Henriciella sp.]|nr:aldose 1-epimerase [Henriciella sp.]